MSLALCVFLFAVGLLFIVKGSDVLVDSASNIANASRIPKFIIGATLVSVATSLPELFVSVFAALQGRFEMAVGTPVGSVIANVGIMMSLAFIYMPTYFKRKDYRFESILGVLSVICLFLLAGNRGVGVYGAIALLIMFGVFIGQNIKSAYENTVPEVFKIKTEEEQALHRKILTNDIIKFFASAVFMLIGSELLVYNGCELATHLGVSERVISTTIIAVGTSLPEMVAAITALSKKQSSISIGNIMGANIINISLILPLCTLLSDGFLPFSNEVANIDILVCLVVTLIAIIPSIIKGKFMRWQGAILLCIYSAYFCVTYGLITV